VSQIIIHETDQPDIVVHFFDADGLASKDRAEIYFFTPQTDAAARPRRLAGEPHIAASPSITEHAFHGITSSRKGEKV
jgi:hypothetical protein